MAFVVTRGQLADLSPARTVVQTSMQLTHDYSAAYGQLWKAHGSVRTVVDFLGRNIGSLGLHLFERVGDTDRQRVTDHPAVRLLTDPAPSVTPYTFLDALVRDLAIYDRYLAVKVKDSRGGVGALVRVPPSMWTVDGSWFAPETFTVNGQRGKRSFKADEVLAILGYSPDGALGGMSPLESLRAVLAEEYEAARMRQQTFRNGARASGYIERPAPTSSSQNWSKEARERFRASWRSQYSGGGPEAGGTPILEDGMKFVAASQTAKDLQYIESRKLTREEVASAYHIPPPMVGLLDKATFSNIKEQHKHLYQDTLGPWLQRIQQELMRQVLAEFGDTSGLYLEFNLEEKLRGSFEEQAAQLQTSVGGPWLTRNEARAMRNLPALEGGDELIVPLNVTEGGQASPRDSAPEAGAASGPGPVVKAAPERVRVKAPEPADEDRDRAVALMRDFFRRQGAAVASAIGAGSADWWDAERWDAELAADLLEVLKAVSGSIGPAMAADLGFEPGDYDMERTLEFLQAVAASRAGAVNAATRDELEAVLADDSEDAPTPAHVFEVAEESRSITAGQAIVTTAAAFASVEAGRQLAGPRAFKVWRVTSNNPRSEHIRMNGETVPIDEPFSNRMDWPGDPTGGAGNVANCRCRVDVVVEH
ncbi:MAG: phage portal protein [Micrococcus sp.]|nr:phage portal protein [Micrococcus sp.]